MKIIRQQDGAMPKSLVMCLIVGALLAGCSHDSATTGVKPTTGVACSVSGSTGTITLNALQTATVNCAQGGTVFELAGGGASYLLVPEFATGNVAITTTSFTLGTPNAAPQIAASNQLALGANASVPVSRSTSRQQEFDARLRAADRRISHANLSIAARRNAAATSANARIILPDPGSIRTFHVISSIEGSVTTTFKAVDARLAYVGTNVLLYVDTLTSNGFAQADLSGIGDLFDKTLYPINVNTFGQPSDLDQNGRLIMLMTPVVNSLVTKADCDQSGFVAGFFTGFDLASTNVNSNQGEVFYTIAPDPAGVSSCAHDIPDIERTVPATFLHEVQHLINFSQHVVVHNAADSEEGWLDEGLSIVAEELGSRYYEQKFPAPTGRTNPLQLFPDSAQGFISGLLTDSYAFLLKPDTATITLHTDADLGLAWRGSVWLLARWLGDLKGEDVYKRLEATALTGTANIEAATGESFQQLFADFGIALYADSLVGVARSVVPKQDRFATRNLRQMYAALFRAAGPSATVPRAFPIAPVTISANQAVSASMEPGTVAYYRIDTPGNATSVQIQFASPSKNALSTALRPQLAIMRLPPGS